MIEVWLAPSLSVLLVTGVSEAAAKARFGEGQPLNSQNFKLTEMLEAATNDVSPLDNLTEEEMQGLAICSKTNPFK